MEKYLDDGAGTLAVILILSKMGVYLSSKPNPYYERMIKAYVDQFDNLWNQTKAKLEKIEPFITSMYERDVFKWIDGVSEDAGFIYYPPFFAGGYEKMFRVINEIFEWSPPEFEILSKERINAMFEKLVQRKYFMFSTNNYLDDFKQYLVGMSQTINCGVAIYIYATSDKSMVVLPRQATAHLLLPHMNVHINPGQATMALGVTVENKLIVVYAFSSASTVVDMNKYIDTPNIYLLSDFFL